MSLDGLVRESDIALLGVEMFRRVINKLLAVEASVHRVPLTDLDLTLREHDPDAGIDARVKWPDAAPHDVLSPGHNVLQYKTGKVAEADVKNEFDKHGVQNCLREGGHYHFLISQDYNTAKLDVLRTSLRALCKKWGFREDQCQILAASQIARWVCRHPAVITAPELGKGLPGFSTVETWTQLPALRNPWEPDEQRQEVMARVQALLEQQDIQDPVIRIEGPAGVGKTRLALECIRAAEIIDRTIYAPNSDEPNVQQLLTLIQSDPRAHAIIVADECDRERQGVFRSYAELSAGRLRLICVGPGDVLFQSPADSVHVFAISPIADGNMRQIIATAMGAIPPEVIDVAVRLSGGYPKLCFFVATAILRDNSVTSEELRKLYSIREFLKRFLAPEILDALRALSLLERLGWEDKLRTEAEAVANYLGMRISAFQEGVKALRDQGVALPRGRYLYVTPDLLAIAAAADLWEIRGPELIGIIETLPDMGPRRELLKRLAAMGRHPKIREAVDKLLKEDGLFKTLGDLDEEFRSEAFRIMASALPDAAAMVLVRIIERAPRDQLLDFKIGRRNVIWAIETLLRWPETSLQAARSLRSLALAENESIGNNATAVFAEYFHIYLSRSPIPFTERLTLIDELTEAGDEPSRALATCAIKSAFVWHETRMGGNVDELARRPYPREWRPATYGELWDARRAALSRLEKLTKGSDKAASEARRAHMACTFTLINDGMFDDVIRILESTAPRSDEERREILDTCARLQSDGGENLSEEQKKKIEQISANVFDRSYFARIRRWVGPRLHSDFDGAGFSQADEIAIALAEEGLAQGISDNELTWLVSPEAENVWVFGLRLGELDNELSFFGRIVAVSSEDINALFLAAYLSGRAKAGGEEARELLIDKLTDVHPMIAFGCTWRGEASLRGIRRIIHLVESGRVPPQTLKVLMYGGWTKALSADEVTELIRLMLGGDKVVALEPSMSMIHGLLQRDGGAIDKMEPLIWELLESTPPDASTMVEWRWGLLAVRVAGRNPKRMVKIIIDQYSSQRFIPLSDARQQALQKATEADPLGAWNMVGEAILRGGQASSALLIVLRKWYAELIPAEHLVSWAKANEPQGPRIGARLISARAGQLSQRARALVLAFRGDKQVWTELYANLITGFWVGPYSNRIERDLTIAKQWANDPDPEFRSWATEVVSELETRLREQKIREEEGEL